MEYNINNISSLEQKVSFDFFKHYDSKILRKFKKNYSVSVRTKYAKVEIRNRLLDKNHRDIIGAIFKHGNIGKQNNSDVIVLVYLQDVLKELCMQKEDEELLLEKVKQISDAIYYTSKYNHAIKIVNSYVYRDSNLLLIFSQKFLELSKFKFI